MQLRIPVSYIFDGKVHTEEEISKLVEQIIKIKKIESQNLKIKLKTILIKSNALIKYKKELASLYQEKINKDNTSHMNMLYDIYSHFNNNDRNIEEIDEKWCKINNIYILILQYIVNIGFQGKDPLTDFRGSGLLGLKHLWRFSLYDLRSEDVYKIATNNKTWYFYAATGINITGKVIQFIEEKNCDKYLYDKKENINLYNFTQNIYNEFFVGFNNMWVEKGYTDFMKVNSSLEEFMETKSGIIFQNLIYNKKIF